jgi:vesicular inhibitory amino acid transporter
MAGIGVLGIPAATASSGWLGLPLLVLTAVICMITANLLGSIMMRMPQSAIRDYPSVGGAAFGRVGVALTMASQYSTLIGVSVIFLLLSGMFLNGIFCQVPARLFTIIIGAVMIGILILIPVMKGCSFFFFVFVPVLFMIISSEVRFMAYIGVLTTFIATWFAIGLSVVYYMNGPCYNSVPLVDQVCTTCQHDPALLTIASGFSVYSFAFGGHSSIPNFFLEMKHPRHFYRTSALVFMCKQKQRSVLFLFSSSLFSAALLLLYLPMGLVGYLAYGRGLDQVRSSVVCVLSSYRFSIRLRARFLMQSPSTIAAAVRLSFLTEIFSSNFRFFVPGTRGSVVRNKNLKAV